MTIYELRVHLKHLVNGYAPNSATKARLPKPVQWYIDNGFLKKS
jgi:hypothetical protein